MCVCACVCVFSLCFAFIYSLSVSQLVSALSPVNHKNCVLTGCFSQLGGAANSRSTVLTRLIRKVDHAKIFIAVGVIRNIEERQNSEEKKKGGGGQEELREWSSKSYNFLGLDVVS